MLERAGSAAKYPPSDRGPGPCSWLIVATITAALTAVSTRQSLDATSEFRSGWAWDLAYYNQWFWALTCGDREITVRPLSRYAEEGPSVWKMNYLAPIRFALAPIYRLFPDPRTLLVIQNIMFWWVIPAAYTLVRSESGSRAAGVSAAALVPLTPLLWPLVLERFPRASARASVRGVGRPGGSQPVERRWRLLGIAGMLACRQEFAVMAATFAFIPPREPEPLTTTLRWRHIIVFAGLSWFLFGFLGYLRFVVGRNAPAFYIQQFLVQKASLPRRSAHVVRRPRPTAWASGPFWPASRHGSRSWRCRGSGARAAASGRCDSLSTADWHHVRYVLPMTALVLAAGLIGYARVGCLDPEPPPAARPGPRWPGRSLASAGAAGCYAMKARMDHIPIPIDAREAAEIWRWIDQVGPDDGVLADYVVSAPLSSRRRLYGYLVNWNLPPCTTRNSIPESAGSSSGTTILSSKCLLDQGFDVVHQGKKLTDRASRSDACETEIPIFWNFARTQNGDRMSILGTTRWRVSSARASDRARRELCRLVSQAVLAWVSGRPGALPGRIDVSGARIGAHDSVTDRRALNRPNPHDATADRSVLEHACCVIT